MSQDESGSSNCLRINNRRVALLKDDRFSG
jgi:hypothetical protein